MPPLPGEPPLLLDIGRRAPALQPVSEAYWTAERIAVAEELWGDGFLFPGGAEETLHFARPLGVAAEPSILMIGASSGGPPCAIAMQLGARVAGFEADPDLAAHAAERCRGAGLGRRLQVHRWQPDAPAFDRRAYHHALAIEPFRVAAPEPFLAAVGEALRPAGQIVLVDLVSDVALDPADPTVAAWRRAERRTLELRRERDVTRTLRRLGYGVRTEDLTQRHLRLAMLGWRKAVREMQEAPPPPSRAALIVAEAEGWMQRLKLMREHRIRLIRWHAFGARREGG